MRRSRRLRVGGLVGLFAVLALAISGCDFEEEFFPPISLSRGSTATSSSAQLPRRLTLRIAFSDFEEFLEGYYEPTGPTTATIHDKIVRGLFRGMFPTTRRIFGRSRASASKSQTVSGTYIADLNGTTDSSSGTAKMTAVGAIKFKDAKQGTACFEMSAEFTNNGSAGKGTFRSTGGTKESAKTRFSGSFTDTIKSTSGSTNQEDSGKITGTAKFGQKTQLPPENCKALLAKLP